MLTIKTIPILDRGAQLTAYIQQPSDEMTANAVKPAMIIFPGGGYVFCSDREAEPIALSYLGKGYQAFVLNYSCQENARDEQPLREAEEAIRLVKSNCEEWFVNPEKIAVSGFSAGGHLALWSALCGAHRPNALVLSYPATKLYTEQMGVSIPLYALLGKDNITPEKAEKLNLAQYVTKDAPPMFVWGTSEDKLVRAGTLLEFASAYAQAEVPFEMHIYSKGIHGMSLAEDYIANGNEVNVSDRASDWFRMSCDWLRETLGGFPVEKKEGGIPAAAKEFRKKLGMD